MSDELNHAPDAAQPAESAPEATAPVPAPARRRSPMTTKPTAEPPAIDPVEYETLRRKLAELESATAQREKETLAEREARAAAERERDRVRVESRVQALAAKHRVVETALADFVETASNRLTIKDGRIVSATDPAQDAETFVESFLKERPHLLAPRVAPGAGSHPYAATPAGAPALDLKTNEGLTALARQITHLAVARPNPSGK